MYPYKVIFEFRRHAHESFRQHRGVFQAETPAAAKNAVFGQLKHLGFETGGYAVYDGERLVMGATIPLNNRLRSVG